MNSKERFLATLNGESVDRVPVFPLLMFFSQQRLGITYREFASNGQAMADAQLNIKDKFPIDAITACSDAFRITADLGGDMVFPEDNPPFTETPLVASETDFEKLGRPDPLAKGSRMADRTKGTEEMVKAAGDDCLVLGWVDMPFAEACSVCGITEFMMMITDNPSLAHKLLDFLTEIVIDFSKVQLDVGAPMIGAGDAAASLISPDQYREFVLPYEERVVKAVHDAGGVVKLHICGDTTHLLGDVARCGADLYNVDHLVDFTTACKFYGEKQLGFKGNIDPVAGIFQATPEQCEKNCFDRLKAAEGLRFMLSGGCEIPGDTPDEVFMAFCEAPQKYHRTAEK